MKWMSAHLVPQQGADAAYILIIIHLHLDDALSKIIQFGLYSLVEGLEIFTCVLGDRVQTKEISKVDFQLKRTRLVTRNKLEQRKRIPCS